jgi:hypothetical protein
MIQPSVICKPRFSSGKSHPTEVFHLFSFGHSKTLNHRETLIIDFGYSH